LLLDQWMILKFNFLFCQRLKSYQHNTDIFSGFHEPIYNQVQYLEQLLLQEQLH
jgi:hypothetical protein